MKNHFLKHSLLFLSILFLGCKKEVQVDQKSNSIENKTPVDVTNEVKSNIIDTIYWDNDKNQKTDNYAFIRLINTTQKDTITNTNFQIDFYKKGKILSSKKIELTDYDEETYWVNNDELNWLKEVKEPLASTLKTVSTEFIGCNTDKNNFLFSVENNKIEILHQWYSSKGYGDGDKWGDFKWLNPGEFVFWSESQELSPKKNEGMIHKFSDSIRFTYKNNKWVKTCLTPKNKVYRTTLIHPTE
ncbi:hypothetical protein V3470_07580 [Flavobacterium oreochromis]|uniref:Lipoprotein n=1 Tax=Flavobacterium oreochromis TaxID=2906078 RepID=A0ABW8P8X9_9FLAO|nr:hypothetical protein [Flavobacterium oreochromis]OWP74078.1 hypothetical protein BWG23_15065 [Flavobacterium oreochromis]